MIHLVIFGASGDLNRGSIMAIGLTNETATTIYNLALLPDYAWRNVGA